MSSVVIAGDTSGSITLQAPAVSGSTVLTLPTTSATLITDSSGILNIGSGQLYKDASGNVGIGTSSPSSILNVKSSAPIFRLETTGTVTSTGTAYNVIRDSTGSDVFVNGFAGLANCYQFATTFTNGFMRFLTGNQAEAVRIDSSGNVGIGTSSPITSSKLSIYAGATTGTTYNVLAATGGSIVTKQQQSTSVSTSAVVILTSGLYASFCVVFGSDGTNRFMDLILCGLGSGTIQVVSSFSVSGSPAARTYTQSSSTYRLAMGSGTYTVSVAATSMTG